MPQACYIADLQNKKNKKVTKLQLTCSFHKIKNTHNCIKRLILFISLLNFRFRYVTN